MTISNNSDVSTLKTRGAKLEQIRHARLIFGEDRGGHEMGRVPRVMTQEEDKYKDRSPKRFRAYATPVVVLVAGCHSVAFDRSQIVPGEAFIEEAMTSLNTDSFDPVRVRVADGSSLLPTLFAAATTPWKKFHRAFIHISAHYFS